MFSLFRFQNCLVHFILQRMGRMPLPKYFQLSPLSPFLFQPVTRQTWLGAGQGFSETTRHSTLSSLIVQRETLLLIVAIPIAIHSENAGARSFHSVDWKVQKSTYLNSFIFYTARSYFNLFFIFHATYKWRNYNLSLTYNDEINGTVGSYPNTPFIGRAFKFFSLSSETSKGKKNELDILVFSEKVHFRIPFVVPMHFQPFTSVFLLCAKKNEEKGTRTSQVGGQ